MGRRIGAAIGALVGALVGWVTSVAPPSERIGTYRLTDARTRRRPARR